MADQPINSQNNYVVVTDQNGTTFRRSVGHLPNFYRTDANQKFLGSTLDAMIQPGNLERLDGYVGHQYAYTGHSSDSYLTAVSEDRKNYQLDPTVTYTEQDTSSINPQDQVLFTATYDDYINQIKFLGGNVTNHDRLNREQIYNWNPAVDFDKLINYREYYWLPNGPNAIGLQNNGPNSVTEVDVTLLNGQSYGFTNYPEVANPAITLYRGNTYKFNINLSGHPFYIMTEPSAGGVAVDDSTSVVYNESVENNGTENGTLIFTVPSDAPDVLYYQCGTNQAMHGTINIKTVSVATQIDVAHEIANTKNYIMSSGMALSNGMKIRFYTNVTDSNYSNQQFYVEGVGNCITLTNVNTLITPEPYAEEVTDLYDTVAYDSRSYATTFYLPQNPDYITIKRNSVDGNAWSRYNRWFHIDVINAAAQANGTTPNLSQTYRAVRPIIEFDSGLVLFNHGTKILQSVTLVDTVTKNIFSEIEGKIGYYIDGYPLQTGMRVLFTNDKDNSVKNRIYNVNFVEAGGQSIIALTESADGEPVDGNTVFVEFGKNNQGKTLYYQADEQTWTEGQTKTALNQQPLFDLFDEKLNSFGDTEYYPNSNFIGAEVFAYQTDTSAPVDTVLNLQVAYSSLNNIGNMLFTSDIQTGSFAYNNNGNFINVSFNTGHLQYNTTNYYNLITSSFVPSAQQSQQRIIRLYVAEEKQLNLFPIDVYANSATLTDLEVQVNLNTVPQHPGVDYELINGKNNAYVQFHNNLNVGDIVELHCYSSADRVPGVGLYEVPENLAVNPFNTVLNQFTFGQILNHLRDIQEKNNNFVGPTPGNSNLRDLPKIKSKGGTILQHTAPLPQSSFLLIDQNANAISSIDYVASEYQKFKESFINYVVTLDYNNNAPAVVDNIIEGLAGTRDNSFPFFYEDMAGFGQKCTVRNYTVQDSSETQYTIDSVFNPAVLSNRAVYVYQNGTQLLLGQDYTFSTTGDYIEISAALSRGDILTVKDYADTRGNFIPPTPTKLGLYPKFKPEIITDNTYIVPTTVIIGHDGSKTVAYGDYRDDILLELEKRIYNNCKTAYNSALLSETEIRPSVFASTDYSLDEVNQILSYDFYVWAGKNGIDYQSNTVYDQSNPFTFNYSQNYNELTGENLPGYWRGIYQYFYDTDRPHTNPWEMIGYSEKPTWWEPTYGPAPYTAGNTVLWNDMAKGFDAGSQTTDTRYRRAQLLDYLPVDEHGNLLSPIAIGLIKNYVTQGTTSNWQFGDQAPAETAWRKSSQYPFSVMKMLALTRPAKFFSLFFDTSRLIKNVSGNLIDADTMTTQNIQTGKYHLETTIDSYGKTTTYFTAGYQPFVVNYLIKNNLDPAPFFYDKMKNLNVQLSYKLGGFTDKNNLNILLDSVSPASTANSQFVPAENYKILLRTSNPVDTYDYSGVLIERISGGYQSGFKVIGYNTIRPYFKVLQPIVNNNNYAVQVGNATGIIYNNYNQTETVVTYGTIFTDVQSVVNFLTGYGKYLESQGFVFDEFSSELQDVANWITSVKEFLYWTRQGWATGSAITLSPGADSFQLQTNFGVVGQLKNLEGQNTLLDSSGQYINNQYISTKRTGSLFEISTKDPNLGIYNASMNVVQKEHILIFDNKTVFSDIILDLPTGYRQERLRLVGWKTANWNGDLYAPGFVFDEAIVNQWTANTDYAIGDTVEYTAKFYVCTTNHNSGTRFDSTNWQIQINKPAAQLLPNFDYKAAQFNNFYSLESSNFDTGQQKLAQHLIGYQSRPYLEGLFINDITQFKFYQGYIREKGTLNAINKLLKGQFYNANISLKLYPEWMIRVGEFGNLYSTNSIQISMPDTEFQNNIQSIELINNSTDTVSWSNSAVVTQSELYAKPLEYNASTTFNLFDYTQPGYNRNIVQKYKTAGYPRIADVDYTVFNDTDLLNLDPTVLSPQSTAWIAKKANSDWDVVRLTFANLRVSALYPLNNNSQVQITFDNTHNFAVGDYVAILQSQYSIINGVYQIVTVTDQTSVVINFANARSISSLALASNTSSVATYGNVYQWISVRLNSMDNVNDLISFDRYRLYDSVNAIRGDRVFADNAGGSWQIFEKNNPYAEQILFSPDQTDLQQFGYRIVARNDGRTLAVSAPGKGQGTVHFFFRKNNSSAFTLTQSVTMTEGYNNSNSQLGESLYMSNNEKYVVAGAPSTDLYLQFVHHRAAGAVKIFQWNSTTYNYDLKQTLLPPSDVTPFTLGDSTLLTNGNFGWSVALCEPIINTNTNVIEPTYLFVGAPGENNSNAVSNNAGVVYFYISDAGNDFVPTLATTLTSTTPAIGNRFGHRVVANSDASIVAISSLNTGTVGQVEIFQKNQDSTTDSTFAHLQTLTVATSDGSTLNYQFGADMVLSKDSQTLIVSAPGIKVDNINSAGEIYIYRWKHSTNTFVLDQTLTLTNNQPAAQFGSSLRISPDGTRIIIGAKFYSDEYVITLDTGLTTLDQGETRIVDSNLQSGAAFTATKYGTKFVLDDQLVTARTKTGNDFGEGVCIIDNSVFVGSPNDNVLELDGSTVGTADGTVAVLDLKTSGHYAWNLLVEEEPLVDNTKIKSGFVFDMSANEILNFLDYYDPVKGRILGIADREINYKTEWDPAVYNIGTATENVNGATAWAEEHVGEVWWDLRTVRWLWYEQGSQEYRTQNWGQIFPGSSIDIYEWIETTQLPSNWNALADTTAGLAQNVSGKPLYPNNTGLTVKQKYDPNTETYVNYYYYWVKNSVFLPDSSMSVVTRENTTAAIANLISNPIGAGSSYFTVSNQNSIITFNVKSQLVNNNTVLNITYGTNDNENDLHGVWKILQEGNQDSRPDYNTEKKWWDSLIGSDIQGNAVPDLSLPLNQRYGNNIRPRQSWYVDRLAALKETIQYANSVFATKQLAHNINYSNLNASDPVPSAGSGAWSLQFDTYNDLIYFDTRNLTGTTNALVSNDSNSNGYWALYHWDGKQWIRTQVQTYNTGLYWQYADWYSEGVSADTLITAQVNYQYQLASLQLNAGQYARVSQGDTSGWKIYQYTDNGFVNVASQNGTIQLSTSLYDYAGNNIGFDQNNTFDTVAFDQSPAIETRYILTALRDDIFIGDLYVEYNNLFFVGLRKVLEEQTFVDWLTPTSFISINSNLKPLDQPKTYTVNDDTFVDSYINEVKPYHTQIRSSTVSYNTIDTEDAINTDFDIPAFFDGSVIRNPNTDTDVAVLDLYPYRFWRDNYKMSVDNVTVTHGGSGYVTAPTVTITGGITPSVGPYAVLGRVNSEDSTEDSAIQSQSGYFYPLYTDLSYAVLADQQNSGEGGYLTFTFDEYPGISFYMPLSEQNIAIASRPLEYMIYSNSSTQATARAIVSNGSVQKIMILNAGSNYTTTPTVVLTGGGVGGVTPQDTAKAYANLENNMIREMRMKMKFDRIKNSATVLEWQAGAVYAYNDLIRYDNDFYVANSAFTATNTFIDTVSHLTKLRGDEPFITATERTLGLYAPNSGMPGNVLSQVMTGVDYGGVMVTGLPFTYDQGWDKSPWYDEVWDAFGASRVKTFYGDGATTEFTFVTAPKPTDVYTVYINGQRQTKLAYRGDGSTVTFLAQYDTGSPANVDDEIQFIPIDDDGVLTPTDDRTLDSLVSGGLFRSVVGVAPSDIIVEGDGFVTPYTSYAPEENVPGSIFDTVDIKVFSAPESGTPFLLTKNYVATGGKSRTFDIGQTPGTQAAVIVSVDGVTKTLGTDYQIDIGANIVVFGQSPLAGSTVSIKSFAMSGVNYVAFNTYTGDGSTRSFTTANKYSYSQDGTPNQLYVTVDGQTVTYTTSTENNLIILNFDVAPATGALIQVGSFNQPISSGKAYAEILSQQVTYQSGQLNYVINYPAGAVGPFSGLTLVQVNGKILRGPDNVYYSGDGSTATFSIHSNPDNTITEANQVEVYVNGNKKTLNIDYTVNVGAHTVTFTSAPQDTDNIAISTLLNVDYIVQGSSIALNITQMTADGITVNNGDTLNITTFNNAAGMNQRRETFAYAGSNTFSLTYTPINSDYVFAWINGVEQTEGFDFILAGNQITFANRSFAGSDVVDVMYFANVGEGKPTGFRIFKDMINRTFYKRISGANTTTLTEDLNAADTTITVADASVLAGFENGTTTMPSVIFIGEERIEYFTKTGNVLSNIRRGTLGTGAIFHSAGSQVVDSSVQQSIPYADVIYTRTSTGDGTTSLFPTSQIAATAAELDVFVGGQRVPRTSYDGNTPNYTVDGSTAHVQLNSAPAAGVQVQIIQKRGKVWYNQGVGTASNGVILQNSTTIQAKFIAGEPLNVTE